MYLQVVTHTEHPDTHTQAHSLPKTTGRVKGKPQHSLSSDISAKVLAVCLTILPFWEKIGLLLKAFVMSAIKGGLFVVVDIQGMPFHKF